MKMYTMLNLVVVFVTIASVFSLTKLQGCNGTQWAVDVENAIQKVEERNGMLTEYIKVQNERLRKLEELMETQKTNIKRQESINNYQQIEIKRLLSKIESYNSAAVDTHVNGSKSPIYRKRQTKPLDVVAFSSRLTEPISGLGHHQTIIFNHIVTNLGNGYNANDGVFVAPVQGVYVFTWTISTNNTKWQVTELVKEGTAYGYSVADSSVKMHVSGVNPDYSTATNTVVLQVDVGQHVWIRTSTHGDGLLDGHNYDTFSGWLLY